MLRRRHGSGQAGFTLIEVMIAVALLGIGTAFITNMFLNSWRLWKRSYDELLMQRDSREAIALIGRALREASPGSVIVSSAGNAPLYSRIDFTDARGRNWTFSQSGYRVNYITKLASGSSATLFLLDHVSTLTFTYPNFQDRGLMDVGLVVSSTPYRDAPRPIVIQLAERVMIRNP